MYGKAGDKFLIKLINERSNLKITFDVPVFTGTFLKDLLSVDESRLFNAVKIYCTSSLITFGSLSFDMKEYTEKRFLSLFYAEVKRDPSILVRRCSISTSRFDAIWSGQNDHERCRFWGIMREKLEDYELEPVKGMIWQAPFQIESESEVHPSLARSIGRILGLEGSVNTLEYILGLYRHIQCQDIYTVVSESYHHVCTSVTSSDTSFFHTEVISDLELQIEVMSECYDNIPIIMEVQSHKITWLRLSRSQLQKLKEKAETHFQSPLMLTAIEEVNYPGEDNDTTKPDIQLGLSASLSRYSEKKMKEFRTKTLQQTPGQIEPERSSGTIPPGENYNSDEKSSSFTLDFLKSRDDKFTELEINSKPEASNVSENLTIFQIQRLVKLSRYKPF